MLVLNKIVQHHSECNKVEERCHSSILASDIFGSVCSNESTSSGWDVLEPKILAQPLTNTPKSGFRETGHLRKIENRWLNYINWPSCNRNRFVCILIVANYLLDMAE